MTISQNQRLDGAHIAARIESAARRCAGLSPATARDVAFHLTDGMRELERFMRFCREPDRLDDGALADLLQDFLLHVPEHLAAAARLYTGDPVCDVFGVGAVESPRDT